MIALIGNLHLLELLAIAGVALLVFGKRLPEVAVRLAAFGNAHVA
jgi:Sec-independent protein translocase protein TatA